MNLDIRSEFPRLPLDGKLDLTYRCNNTCRHCWLWLPPNAKESQEELSFDDIKRMVDEARTMGCQAWSISGGEPMLRPDFSEIFDYVTRKAVQVRLNTNGTLITPEIAHLMTRNGKKMVAIYGATAEVHDRVTRNPGSFEDAMRGFAYLKEAGAEFIVQIIPMRENFHQYEQMRALADKLSPVSRIGAPWLWLSSCKSDVRNREIARQRLEPIDVISLDTPNPVSGLLETTKGDESDDQGCSDPIEKTDDRLFADCIKSRRDFHIDPYGKMSFCYYVKDPALRYDLRQGTFREAWDKFIPSLANVVHGGQEYLENCGSCELYHDCRWCAVYGFLEHGRYSAKVEYLCKVAGEAKKFKEDWKLTHLRYYQIAGITLQVATDFQIKDDTFLPIFEKFRVDGPGEDTISIQQNSSIPDLSKIKLGKEIFHQPPWIIYQQKSSYIYKGISSNEARDPYLLAIFNSSHNNGNIYRDATKYPSLSLNSLTGFVTDQLLIARILADRKGCYLHAAGIIINNQGLLFVGHSDAGKSTILKMLRGQGEILCDDRIIVRRWPEGFRIHGTWSHGELPDVSPSSAPLKAIFYLEKAETNELIPINDKKERLGRVLSHVVKPLLTADWWEKTLDLAWIIAVEVPTYRLRFDKSGRVVDLLKQLE